MRSLGRNPCVLAMVLLLPDSTAAQVPQDTARGDTLAAQVYELEELSVVVPRPTTTTGGASAVSVQIDSLLVQPVPTLEQVLRRLPLVQIRINSRGEAQPALRGSEDRQVAVLVDGIPLTLGWDHRTDLSVIPLTAARQITLIRGLSSVLHGPNVLGGVVEIDVARGAERQAAPEPLTLSGAVDHLGGRSIGLTGGTLLERPSADWIVRGGLGYRGQSGFAVSDDVVLPLQCVDDCWDWRQLLRDDDVRRNSDVLHVDAFGAARYRSDGGRWLSLAASGYTTERGVPPEIHTQEPRFWRYPEQSRVLAALTGGTGQRLTPWGEGDLELSLGVDLGHTRIDAYDGPSYDQVVGGESADDRTLTLRFLGDHSIRGTGELRGALTLAEVSRDEVLTPGGADVYRQRLWSLGAETEWALGRHGPSAATRLSFGLAVDGADTPESGDKPPLGRLWDWGARLGATGAMGDGDLLLHAGVSRRARFPALRELYSGALGRFVPNPALKGEVLVGGEAGLTLRRRRLELQAVGFHQQLRDAIVRTVVVPPGGGGPRFMRVNRDEIRSTGLELLGLWATSPLSITGDLTLQRVRIHGSGVSQEPEYEPTLFGKLSADLLLPAALRGSAGVRYTGEQFCVDPQAAGSRQTIGASGQLDIGLRRGFGARAGTLARGEIALLVDNATDAVVYDQCGLPQPGRTLRLQLRLW